MTDKSDPLEALDEQVAQELEFDIPDSLGFDSLESIEELVQLLEYTLNRLDELEQRVAKLEQERTERREQTVATTAVENALQEYGLSAERVDEIVTTIEAVDEELGGDPDV